jgi:hypothetical protein
VLRDACREYIRGSLKKEAEPRGRGYSGVQRRTKETRELELEVQKLYNKV